MTLRDSPRSSKKTIIGLSLGHLQVSHFLLDNGIMVSMYPQGCMSICNLYVKLYVTKLCIAIEDNRGVEGRKAYLHGF